MKNLFVALITLFACLSSSAQAQIDRNKILGKRLDKLFFYHVGAGLELACNQNYMLSPKIFFGVGSSRNLFNADMGFKFSVYNSVKPADAEYIRYCYMPLFLSGYINAIRWKQNAIYIGSEIAYNIGIESGHHTIGIRTENDVQTIAKSHVSCRGKLGCNHKNWDFSIYYEHDLSPAIDQKYVYESVDYNYDKLYDSILERWRLGMSVTYNFRF